MTGGELRRLLHAAQESGGYVDTITVTGDSYLVLPTRQLNGKGNHSCRSEPVVGGSVHDRRPPDIEVGEELTNDYATSTGDERLAMPCRCGPYAAAAL